MSSLAPSADRVAGTAAQHPPFTPTELRRALGQFPTGVTVITGFGPAGRPVGITVNSFTSVSLDPPLVSFNAARSLASVNDLLAMDGFVVNVLTEAQSGLSNNFARANTDKWAAASSRRGRTGQPVLQPTLAVFECEKYAVHEAGDHLIILGRVLHFEIDPDATPLVFFRGGYRCVGSTVGER